VNFELCDSSFDMDIFKDDKCNTQYSAPHNFCETAKTINPVIPECSYHLRIQDDKSSTEYYGVHTQQIFYPFYLKRIDNGADSLLVRYDISVRDSFYCKIVRNGQCTDGTGNNDSPNWVGKYLYDSASYPKDAKCPDNMDGCKLYCLDSTEQDCITLDAAGRFVKSRDEVWTYYNEPQMSVFEDDKCEDPEEHLPAPVNICKTKKVLNPKYGEECTFHLTFHESDDLRRDEDHFDVYGIVVDDKIVALKIIIGKYTTVARLDVQNDEGKFYLNEYESDNPCGDSYVDQDYIDELLEMVPQPFWYDGSNYPVDTKCPDGSDGCSKYCIVPRTCIVADAAGRIVQNGYGVWTYNPAPSVDMFAVDTCKGEHIPAPTGCNGGQSSTPNPPEPPKPSTSATSAPISSASIVKSAFTFVAILIVVALL